MSVYQVHSYHINVGVGDAALHLLVSATGTAVAKTFHVLKAIMLDAGDNVRDAPDNVAATIQDLARLYVWDEETPKLDAVIITHWDSDHYKGLPKILLKDIAQQKEKMKQQDIDSKKTPRDEDQLNKDVQISFFKYVDDSGAPVAKGRKNPKTTFYCPVWDKDEMPGTRPKDMPTTHWPQFSQEDEAGEEEKGVVTKAMYLSIHTTYVVPHKPKRPFTEGPEYTRIARLDHGVGLLGMEFFFGDKLYNADSMGDIDPPSLVRLYRSGDSNKAKKDMPGMYCMAVNGTCLVKPPNPPSPDPSANDLAAVAAPKRSRPRRPPFRSGPVERLVNEPSSATNRSSIAVIIMWPPATATAYPRLSLYSAGDMEETMETQLVLWLTKPGKYNAEITSVKLSHHGSATSTPEDLVWAAEKNMIASAGTEFGHPRWEMLVLLGIFQRSGGPMRPGEEEMGKVKLWGMCFPYWMIKKATDSDDNYFIRYKTVKGGGKILAISIAAMDPDTPKPPEFVEMYNEFYEDWVDRLEEQGVNDVTPNMYAEFQAMFKDPGTKKAKRAPELQAKRQNVLFRWAEKEYRHILSTIDESYAPPHEHKVVVKKKKRSDPDPDAVEITYYVEPHKVASTPMSRVKYIFIQSENSDLDGTIVHPEKVGYQAPTVARKSTEAASATSSSSSQSSVTNSSQSLSSSTQLPADFPKPYPKFFGDLVTNGQISTDDVVYVEEDDDRDEAEFNEEAVEVALGQSGGDDSVDVEKFTDARARAAAAAAAAAASSSRRLTTSLPRAFPTGNYYFCSGRIVRPAGQANAVTVDQSLDTFVGTLHTGWISVDKPPSDGSPAKLLPGDEMFSWLTDTVKATNMKIYGSGQAINSADLQINFSVDTKGAPISLYFNTTTIHDTFKPDGVTLPSDTLPPLGFLYGDSVLVFGLTTPTTTSPTVVNTTFISVCTELGLVPPTFGLLQPFDVSLELDLSTPGQRNAIWFFPSQQYGTILRLRYKLSDIAAMNTAILNRVKLSADSANLIVRSSHQYDLGKPQKGQKGLTVLRKSSCQLTFSAKIRLQSDVGSASAVPFVATISHDFGSGDTDLILICNGDSLTRFVQWVEDILGISTGISDLLHPDWDPAKPRKFMVRIDKDFNIQNFQLDFEIKAPFGTNVAFLFSYTWTRASSNPTSGMSGLRASVWPGLLQPLTASDLFAQSIHPVYEEENEYQPITVPLGSSSLTIQDLLQPILNIIPGSPTVHVPDGIPDHIWGLNLVLQNVPGDTPGSKNIQVEFFGSLACWQPDSKVPGITLDTVSLDLSYVFGVGTFDLALDLKVTLPAPEGSTLQDTILTGSVNYHSDGTGKDKDTQWQITAMAHDIYAGHLVSLFEEQEQGRVMEFIEHISIESLTIEYDYDSDGEGSHFLVQGILALTDQLSLTLSFEHFPGSWTFDAVLLDPGLTETVNGLIGGICSDFVLPSYVGDINLLADAELALHVRPATIGTDRYLLIQVELSMGPFDVLFIQYKKDGWAKPKRIFRALVGKLQLGDTPPPIIDKLEQPFDEMYFMYVQDSSGGTDAGLLRQEVQMLNEQAGAADPHFKPIYWQETKKPTTVGDKQVYNPLDVVVHAGLHFAIVLDLEAGPTVVLDHIFGSHDSSDPAGGSGGPPAPGGKLGGPADPDPADPGEAGTQPGAEDATVAKMKKTIGPLSISNVGIKMQGTHLLVLLDATLTLGPMELDLVGFGLDVDLGAHGASLMSLPGFTVSLQGLGFGLNKPPLNASGFFEKTDQGLFVGGVSVGFEPYLFLASGCYGIIHDPTHGDFKTVALFCELEGPLIELEFAEVSEICGGFGYNSLLKFPDLDSMFSFPFIKQDSSVITGSALDTVKAMGPGGWVTPKLGSLWFAAGLTMDAFKAISAKAVVAVDLEPSVKLGIFADVIYAFPPLPSREHIVYVELGLAATVDFGAGAMVVEGKLSPNSFILDPMCHLAGGFALCYWFGASQHAGDWVLSIGGYHPAYSPPSHYPVVSDRLSISWDLGGCLSITGEAYFALTPKICMGGTHLRASLSLSPLYAYFEAWADFLIKFQPFYFMGDAGVAIGVEFTLDLWICTIHISVDISATLHLEGPPMHGYVHVDFWVFGFDIYFGNSDNDVDPLDLQGFYKLLKQTESQASFAAAALAVAAGTATGSGTAGAGGTVADPNVIPITDGFTLSCTGGLIPPDTQGTDVKVPGGQPWQARAGSFQFAVKSVIAMKSATVTQGESVPGTGQPIYARPMELADELQDTTVTVDVYVEHKDPKTKVVTKVVHPGFRLLESDSNVPAAMWGQYSTASDPLAPNNDARQPGGLLDGKTNALVPQMMGVTVVAPKPVHSVDKIAKYNALDAGLEGIADTTLPSFDKMDGGWDPVPTTDSVPGAWRNATIAPVQAAAVADWIAAMGWGKSGVTMTAAPPGKALDQFDDYYLVSPLMTAVAAG